MRPLLTVWATADSPRLRYVLDWLLKERLGLDYQLASEISEEKHTAFTLSYGWRENSFCVENSDELNQKQVPGRPADIRWNGLWAPYLRESNCQVPFDLFAGIFFLLSRAEEYERFTPDRHGRYPATDSVLHQFGFLQRPVLDEWVEYLRLQLEKEWSIDIPAQPFSCQLTYDLDIPWKYRYKSAGRSLGAAFRDLLKGDIKEVAWRIAALRKKKMDPYDSFEWLNEQHKIHNIHPIWFILAAEQPSDFDRNASPNAGFMQKLIGSLSKNSEIGSHPSYYSDVHPERLISEKALLERIAGQEIVRSRQHFIRLRFPETYRALMDAGFQEDYSMGYSTYPGFRAGTGHSFLWYDLMNEKEQPLRIHPFVFMDTTARFDQGLTPGNALQELLSMVAAAKKCNSRIVTIMHNFSLGEDKDWKGWREMYERFLEAAIQSEK